MKFETIFGENEKLVGLTQMIHTGSQTRDYVLLYFYLLCHSFLQVKGLLGGDREPQSGSQ